MISLNSVHFVENALKYTGGSLFSVNANYSDPDCLYEHHRCPDTKLMRHRDRSDILRSVYYG